MKLLTIVASAFGVCLVSAHPMELETRQATNIDITILQFALTLEHLENAFYLGVLQKFSAQDFADAGYSGTYYNNLKYIASDEQAHVKLLTSAIQATGTTPVAPCTYSFPYTDVPSFITLSSVLEGVGTSAYLGGAPLITSKAYLTVAGAILVTEALHTSYQRAAIGEVPFANPLGTPLDPMAVFTLAASFITSCPASNPALPFTAFPALSYNNSWGLPSAGDEITLTASTTIPDGSYVTFISGLSVVSVQGWIDGNCITVTIPSIAQGQTYVLITNADIEGTLVDSAVLFGPAVVEVAPPPPVVDPSIL